MSDSTQSDSWPAWKIALALGIPVAVGGVGYYIYKKKFSDTSPPSKPTSVKEPSPKLQARKDPEGSSTPDEDPFKRAKDFKNEGNAAFKQGKYHVAIEHYTQAIELCPKSKKQELSTFHQNKAAAHEKLENWQAVIDECTKAIELNPRYVKALFRRSRALETLGRKSECLEDMTAVCIMEQFQNPTSMMFADRVLKEMGKEMASERYKARESVMPSLLFVKQYFGSFTEDIISQPITEKQKLETHSGYIRARLAFDKGDLAKVIPECTTEIENNNDASQEGDGQNQHDLSAPTSDEPPPYHAAALLLRGTLQLLQGNSIAAKPDLERVIDMDLADIKLRVNALIKRGSLYMQEQHPDKAQEDFDYAVKLDPENTDVLHHRGQLHILLEKTEDALKDFETCMRIKPDFALAHAQHCYSVYRQAFTRRDVVETQHALGKFEDLIVKTPNCSESFNLYAQALTDQGNFQRADEMFVKAIELEPDNATQYVHRGLLCLQWKQDINKSIQLIEKALEIDGKCDFAHETMGTIEVQRGNLDKACEHFEIAINLAKSEMEMAHLFSLKAAAVAQGNLAKKYGIKTPNMTQPM
ncbi:mitochondrial import receptor subunit TOM70-like [Styela clava]